MTVKRSALLMLLCCGLVGVLIPQYADAASIRFTGQAVYTPADGPEMCTLTDVWAYTGLVWSGCTSYTTFGSSPGREYHVFR